MSLANDFCKDDMHFNSNLLMGSVHIKAMLSILAAEKVRAKQFERHVQLKVTTEQTIGPNIVDEQKLIKKHEQNMKEDAWRMIYKHNLDTVLGEWEEGLPLVLDNAKAFTASRPQMMPFKLKD
eukprot:Gb_02165 [translate_table: standard]